MKKFLSMLLAVALVLSLGVVAMAAAELPAAVDGVITLTENVDLANTVTISEEVTIDLNGYTITCETSDALLITSKVTIQDNSASKAGTIISKGRNSGAVWAKGASANVTLQSGTFKSDYAQGSASAVFSTAGATVTVDGATIEGLGANHGICPQGKNSTVNVKSGSVKGACAIIGQGNPQNHGTKITISGGTIEATNGTGIYHPQDGELTVSGGSISGATGIEMRAGTLNVTGGTITATAGTLQTQDNPSGTSVTGAAIAVSQHTTDLPVTVNISDGTFDGANSIYEGDQQGHAADEGAVTINITGGDYKAPVEIADVDQPAGAVTASVTGGTFVEDPSTYVPVDENVVSTATSAGEKKYHIGDKAAEAIATAESGDTVTIQQGTLKELYDVAEGVTIVNQSANEIKVNGKAVAANTEIIVAAPTTEPTTPTEPAKPVYRDTVTIEIGGEKTEEEAKTETETEANPNTGAPSFIGAAVAVSVLALGGIVLSKKK